MVSVWHYQLLWRMLPVAMTQFSSGAICHVLLVTARNARMYRFCLVCVCLSVRAQKVHLEGSKLLKLTWKLELGMLGMRSSHIGDHPMVPVHLTGPTNTFWDGLGCLSGAFCPFNGLCSTPNHFKTLPGHADKKSIPILPHLPIPPAAGCAIQPWADSSSVDNKQSLHIMDR